MENDKIKELRKIDNNKLPKKFELFGWLNPVNKGGFYTYMYQDFCLTDNCYIDICRDEEFNFYYVPQSQSSFKSNNYISDYQFCVSERGF